jgi:hypothetical protein
MITANVIPASREPTTPASPARLLEVFQQTAAERGHSVETIRAYGDWTTRFILFHGKRHPRDLTNAEVGHLIGHVAQTPVPSTRSITSLTRMGARRSSQPVRKRRLHDDSRAALPLWPPSSGIIGGY